MAPEPEGKYQVRSSNLYGDPQTVLEVYGYDVDIHAEEALSQLPMEAGLCIRELA